MTRVTDLHEARFYQPLPGDKVLCALYPHDCHIPNHDHPGRNRARGPADRMRSISYTFTEPTLFHKLAYDTAVLAREQGLKNNFVSNGFISEAPLRAIAPLLDAANIDLKFFREASYRRISRARLQPILEAIRLYHELGVWLEVTTLVIPGLNDSDAELTGIATFLSDLDPAIPWHLRNCLKTHLTIRLENSRVGKS
jgi:pyruvate-formate lyase-activating enzyme